jgi:ubiquinone/menaquinone biosynthesis C-methylase UbiE
LQIEHGSIYDLPFEARSFDGVFCCWLFEHLDRPEAAIREISRVLQPDGYACIVVPSARTVARTFYDDVTHVRPYTETSLTQLAREAGFSRYQVSSLFFTRASSLISRRFRAGVVDRYLHLSDKYARRVGLVNRDNLILEGWQ